MANENALVPVAQYAVMTMPQADLQEVFQENLGGGQINASDLDRVKFPSGGATFWTVPTLEGDTPMKELVGVIIYQKDSRAFFDKPFEEKTDGEPPRCYSDDAQTGMMLVGDDENAQRQACECATCPFAQFGSARDGVGQACSINKNLFLITKESLLPLHVRIPAGSYKIAKKYLIGLTGKMKPYYAVASSLKLQEAKNQKGIKYAELVIGASQVLSSEEAAQFKTLHEQFKPMLSQVRTESATFTDSGVFGDGDGEEIGGVDID